MNLAWTIGESETQEMFVGLEALVLQRDYGSTKVVTFTDSECIDNFCDLCYDSSIVTVFWVAVCFVLTIPPLFINYNRASKKRDRNVQKFWYEKAAADSTGCSHFCVLVVHNNFSCDCAGAWYYQLSGSSLVLRL